MEKEGGHFAWGETQEKTQLGHEYYKFGAESPYSKYQPKEEVLVKKHWFRADEYQTVGDNKTVLDLCDDAAHVKLGDKWRMPTLNELKELCSDDCVWTCQTVNGKKGCVVMSKKKGFTDKWIFFPFARLGESLLLWSSTLSTNHNKAYCLRLNKQGKMVIHRVDDTSRYFANCIRPVME